MTEFVAFDHYEIPINPDLASATTRFAVTVRIGGQAYGFGFTWHRATSEHEDGFYTVSVNIPQLNERRKFYVAPGEMYQIPLAFPNDPEQPSAVFSILERNLTREGNAVPLTPSTLGARHGVYLFKGKYGEVTPIVS